MRASGGSAEAASEVAGGLKLVPHAPAMAYVSLAQIYESAGDRAQGEAALKYAESLPGGVEAVGLGQADTRIEQGDNAGAEQILRGLAARFPGDQTVWATLGTALFAQNRNDDALDAFGRSLSLAPDDPQVRLYAARTLHKLGRNGEAFEQCRLALSVDPGNAAARALMSEIANSAGR